MMDKFDSKAPACNLPVFGLEDNGGVRVATNYHLCFSARLAAGAFVRLASSLVRPMVGDFIPPERAAAQWDSVTAAFPVAPWMGACPAGPDAGQQFGCSRVHSCWPVCVSVTRWCALALCRTDDTAVNDHDALAANEEILSPVRIPRFASDSMIGRHAASYGSGSSCNSQCRPERKRRIADLPMPFGGRVARP